MDLTGYAVALPVAIARPLPNRLFLLSSEIAGTAFSIGGDFFLTAGHVVSDLPKRDDLCLAVPIHEPGANWCTARVVDHELLSCDLAVLRLEYTVPESASWFKTFRWSQAQVAPLSHVRSVGYAYGLQTVADRKNIIARAFQGYVVARLTRFLPVGVAGPPFGVYELSFAAPRGLSGSPLFNGEGPLMIHGVVIGNSESRMTVFRSAERVDDGAKEKIIEQYEALTLGVAVQAVEILNQECQILGGTIGEHLSRHDLLG